MTTDLSSYFKLVVTVALGNEVPVDWLLSRNIPVVTLKALKAGALKRFVGETRGILIVITGAGPAASEEAALWIATGLRPLFVLNIGTSGIVDGRGLSPGQWIQPESVSDERGGTIRLDPRIPLPHDVDICRVSGLLSVSRPVTENKGTSGYDAVDMEAYYQAKVFLERGIPFHCIKYGSDYVSDHSKKGFNRYLEQLQEEVKGLFGFIDEVERGIRVSVVIPVHNRERTIGRALESVLKQTHRPDEIVVVDDGSTDGTYELLSGYSGDVRIVRLERNMGVSKARNAGINASGAGWIALLDSDDCWMEEKLSGQIAFLRRYPFFEIVQSEEIWFRNGVRVNPCRHHKKPQGWIWKQSLERCLISPSAVFVKRSVLEKHGMFREDLQVCEDYDLWLKIARKHPVGLDSRPSVIKYGGHEDQLSSRYPAMDRFRVDTLASLLREEEEGAFIKDIIPVLRKKLKVLLNGYGKRNKTKEAKEVDALLAALNGYEDKTGKS